MIIQLQSLAHLQPHGYLLNAYGGLAAQLAMWFIGRTVRSSVGWTSRHRSIGRIHSPNLKRNCNDTAAISTQIGLAAVFVDLDEAIIFRWEAMLKSASHPPLVSEIRVRNPVSVRNPVWQFIILARKGPKSGVSSSGPKSGVSSSFLPEKMNRHRILAPDPIRP